MQAAYAGPCGPENDGAYYSYNGNSFVCVYRYGAWGWYPAWGGDPGGDGSFSVPNN